MVQPSQALFRNCNIIYDAMQKVSEIEELEGEKVRIYHGHLTRLFSEYGIAVPYYTSVTRRLRDMDCIRQIRRGGGNAPSVWLLVQAPTEEMFEKAPETLTRPGGRSTMSFQLRQQIIDLNNRLNNQQRDIDLLKDLVIGRTTREELHVVDGE
jgi:hypothetical protein